MRFNEFIRAVAILGCSMASQLSAQTAASAPRSTAASLGLSVDPAGARWPMP
jgi:hypothetical protein